MEKKKAKLQGNAKLFMDFGDSESVAQLEKGMNRAERKAFQEGMEIYYRMAQLDRSIHVSMEAMNLKFSHSEDHARNVLGMIQERRILYLQAMQKIGIAKERSRRPRETRNPTSCPLDTLSSILHEAESHPRFGIDLNTYEAEASKHLAVEISETL